jgi:hypothetical protein
MSITGWGLAIPGPVEAGKRIAIPLPGDTNVVIPRAAFRVVVENKIKGCRMSLERETRRLVVIGVLAPGVVWLSSYRTPRELSTGREIEDGLRVIARH